MFQGKPQRGTQIVKTNSSTLKVGPWPFKRISFICFNRSPLKMMKNAFCSILKALVVLKIYFFSWLFGYVENTAWLEIKVNFKIYDITVWLTITIHILPNISRSKGNRTMILGQLTEYNTRNISLQKSCRKWIRETSSRPLFVFRRRFIWGKNNWYAASFQY